MKIDDFFVYLSILNHNPRILGLIELNFENFS